MLLWRGLRRFGVAIDGAARAMAAARNVDEWVRADLRFHLSVLEAGGNELLVPLGALRSILGIIGEK